MIQKPPPTTIQSLYRDTPPGQAMCACGMPHAPRAGRPYRGLYRGPATPCRGRALALSWPSPARLGLLCHNTMEFHCIVTQMGSSSSSFCFCNLPFFFHTIFFFFYSSYWKTTQKKKKKNFHFPINQINLLKKNFPILHNVKP